MYPTSSSSNNQFSPGYGGCGFDDGNASQPHACKSTSHENDQYPGPGDIDWEYGCSSNDDTPPVHNQYSSSNNIGSGHGSNSSPKQYSLQPQGWLDFGGQGMGLNMGSLSALLNSLIQMIMQLFGQGGTGGGLGSGFNPFSFLGSGGSGGGSGTHVSKQTTPPQTSASGSGPQTQNQPPQNQAPQTDGPGSSSSASGNYNSPPHGYAPDWHTIRFSNTTNEPVTIKVTVAAGQQLPKGVDGNGCVTIPPGQYVDVTFAPGTSANFKSTKGDGSVWNQGEVYFDESRHVIWGNMSYIYGANSNMRMFSQDGQHSGYLGDVIGNAPGAAKVGNWGVMAPYDRNHHSDDPNNPNSAAGGPNGAKNAGSTYFYSNLKKGEGYVGRGRPAEVSDYDDASSLQFHGSLAVVL